MFEMTKDAFGVGRMMWGSDFPPAAGREGYGNALRWCDGASGVCGRG